MHLIIFGLFHSSLLLLLQVGFKSTDEIVALGKTDPLVSESPTGEPVFNFKSAAEREEQSAAANGSTGTSGAGGSGSGESTAATPNSTNSSSTSSVPKRVTKRAKFIALYSLPPDEVRKSCDTRLGSSWPPECDYICYRHCLYADLSYLSTLHLLNYFFNLPVR